MADVASQVEQVRPSRLANGFNRLTRDLHRAIAAARFSPAEYFLVHQAMELCWFLPSSLGSDEPEPFRFNLSELARISGLNRTALWRASGRLESSCVILPSPLEPDLYLVGKDYQLWGKGAGKLPLSPTQITWCRAIIRRSKPVAERQQTVAAKQHLPATPPVAAAHQCSAFAATPPVAAAHQCSAFAATGDRVPPTPPSCEAPASERVKKREERGEEEHTRGASVDVDGPGRIAARIVAKCRDEDNGDHYRSEAKLWCDSGYPEPVVMAAIEEAHRKTGDNGLRLVRFVAAILPDRAAAAARKGVAPDGPRPPAYFRAPAERPSPFPKGLAE